jgi:hypothetical protein
VAGLVNAGVTTEGVDVAAALISLGIFSTNLGLLPRLPRTF